MAVTHVVAGALIDAAGQVLLAQRPGGKHLAGYWEFPGGKVEPGEAAVDALRRELNEELGVRIGAAEPLIRIPWTYSDKQILLDVYRVHDFHGIPASNEGQAIRWMPVDALDRRELPAADHPVITALQLPDCYLITPEPDPHKLDAFLQRLEIALSRDISIVQLRAKYLPEATLRELAVRCKAIVHEGGAKLLINSRIDLAETLGLDGVHLTSTQLSELQRRPVPDRMWVGASCHSAVDVKKAMRLGADFATVGTVNATPSHPDIEPLGWRRFAQICDASTIPVYALGGTRRVDLAVARSAGAQGIAAIRGLW